MTGYDTPAECLAELDRLEEETGRRWSMYHHAGGNSYRPSDDAGHSRNVACATKRLYTSKAKAKASLKTLKRQGRRSLVVYACWYSRNGDHYHLGHEPGEQTYYRSGRVYG